MAHNCPACGTANDDWRPFCTKCSLRLDGARHGVPGTAGSALHHYRPDPPGAAGTRPRGWGRAVVTVVFLAAIAGVSIGGVELAQRLDPSSSSLADPAPKHWDRRLAPLVESTESLRGLEFKHPVAARFYSDAEFDRLSTSGLDKAQTRENLARVAAEFRALGIAPPGLDLAKSVKSLQESTALAFYDPVTKRISVRGTTLDVSHDVTIVHELTHALQDQHFDLRKMTRTGDDGDDAQNEADEVRTLIEGDARDVENRYVDSLPKARKHAYDAEQQRLGRAVGGQIGALPDALLLSQQAPYDIGERFVRALREIGGAKEVDRAFRNAPRSDWYYLDPVAYLDDANTVKVARPTLPTGAELLDDQGETGSFGLFLLLSERIDAHDALEASDAWRGDRTTLYRLHNTTCVDIDIAARDNAGRTSIETALRAWSAQMPPGHTKVTPLAKRITRLHACDGGARTPPLTHRSLQAYVLPVTRLDLLDAFLGEGAEPQTAWCAAGQVVYSYSPAELNDPKGAAFQGPAFVNRVRGWIRGCRS